MPRCSTPCMFNPRNPWRCYGLKLETMRLSSPQLGKMTVLDQRVWRDRYTADIEQKWGEYVLWRRGWNSVYLPPRPTPRLNILLIFRASAFSFTSSPRRTDWRWVCIELLLRLSCTLYIHHKQTQHRRSIGICQLVLSTDKRVSIAWMNWIQGGFAL